MVCAVLGVEGQLGWRGPGVQEGSGLAQLVQGRLLQPGLGHRAEDLRGPSGSGCMLPPRATLGGGRTGEGRHPLFPDGWAAFPRIEIGAGKQHGRRLDELGLVFRPGEHGAGREALRAARAALEGGCPLPEGGLAEAGVGALLLRKALRLLEESRGGLVRRQRSRDSCEMRAVFHGAQAARQGRALAFDVSPVRAGGGAVLRAQRAGHRGDGGADDAGEKQHGRRCPVGDLSSSGAVVQEAGLLPACVQKVHASW
mmetsp:Transcript_126058/g.364765  ORF Transcript_126058/g.364765 Transcript_126058/m.364765 type:complete len:255 (+) Transcript_126058:2976-3740(+)